MLSTRIKDVVENEHTLTIVADITGTPEFWTQLMLFTKEAGSTEAVIEAALRAYINRQPPPGSGNI